jgi:hypothetical protein
MNTENFTNEEFKKSQEDFRKKISSHSGGMGIEDELCSMRLLRYMRDGKAGVQLFDQKLFSSFGDYQKFLMNDEEESFTFSLKTKAEIMYESLCLIQKYVESQGEKIKPHMIQKELEYCLSAVGMENIL